MEQLETRITPTLLSTSLLAPYGTDSYGNLLLDKSGNLYGTAADGGAFGDGTVFELVHGSNTLTTLAAFNGTNGANPHLHASLIMDSSGNLYGTTVSGGTANDGTVFELPAGSSTITTLATFTGANGDNPYCGLVMDSSGNLYGTTANGGPSDDGTVFEVAAGSGTISTLATFNGTNGENPLGALIRDSSGNLYGTTYLGGASSDGTVFELAAGSGTITTLASFNGTNGSQPKAGLLMDGSGNLYGTAERGGASGYGTVFEVVHGGGTITALASFNFDGSSGALPQGSLVMDGSGNLYGTTEDGPNAIIEGSVFELAAGSSTITTLATFGGSRGALPPAGLVMDGSGNLYGTAQGANRNAYGTVFELAPGSGTLTILARFAFPAGRSPLAGVVMDGSGNLYGTALGGGPFNDGTVYELAAGSGAITALASFNGTNGRSPIGGMVLDSNGNLYGTANDGGPNGDGTVFEVAAGSGTITTLAAFNGTNGAYPFGDLLMDSRGNLYGTTEGDGVSSYGTVFEILHGSSAITTLASFPGGNEQAPEAGLIMDGQGNLYGTATGNGSGGGAVFELPAGSNTITTLATFNGSNGSLPLGKLLLDSHGDLFGTTARGGASGGGTIFEVVAGSGTITTLVSFDGTNEDSPEGGLIADRDGNLYGTTSFGGGSNNGVVFELAAGSDTVTTLASFSGSDGSEPYGSLLMDSSGNLYGTTPDGGTSGLGTVFELVKGITLSPATLPAASVGAGYSQTLTASGGTAPYTFAVTAGSLPDGLNLSTGGVLSGTPTAAGSFTFTVTATDHNSKTGSQPYTLTVGLPAASFSVTGFPSPATAGAAGTFTVTALNADGTVDTHYAGTVHLTSDDPQAVLPADYAFMPGDFGVHSFNATLKTAGMQSLTATDAGDSLVVGAEPVTVVPAAADHWAFTQQPADTTAGQTIDGSSVPAGVRVGLFDQFNNLETGDNLDTVTLAIHSGPSTSLLGTLTQTVSGGVAVFGDLALDTAGSYVLQASSSTQSALPAIVSASLVIRPAAPDHLTFTQQPTNATAGQTINAGTTPPGVRVTLYDAFNNLETGDGSDAITLAVQSGPSNSLLGTLTQTANGGVAVFLDLSLNTAGSYTLQATSPTRPALAPAPSAGFAISPAGFDHLAFAQQPTDTPAGQAIDGSSVPAGVRVGLFDRFGNLETGDRSDSAALAVQSGPSRSLLGTLTQPVSGGVAVFPDLSLDTAGGYALEATSPTRPTLAAVVSAGFVISPTAPDHLAFLQQPTSTVAGQALNGGTVPPGVRVGIFDRFNNLDAGDGSDAVTLAVLSGPSPGLLGTRTQTAGGGVAVFGDLSLDTAGSYTLQASSPTLPRLPAAPSLSFTVTGGALDHLGFAQQPADTTAGQTIDAGTVPAGVRVALFDRFNNPVAAGSGDTVTVAVRSGPGGLLGTLTQTANGSVAVFPDLALDAAGSYTLQASSATLPALAAVVSASFVIRPAAPDHLTFAQQPTDTTAGQTINGSIAPVGVQVRLYDAFNNLETADIRDNVTLAVRSGPGGSLLGRVTEGASGGEAEFPDVWLDAAGSYTLQATCPTTPGVAAATSASFTISPAALDHLTILQQPTDTAAGQAIDGGKVPAGVRIGLFDAFNNPEVGDSSNTVALAVQSGPDGSILLGTPTERVGGGVAVFPDLSLDVAGSYTLLASSPTQPEVPAVISSGFTITAAAPDHLTFAQQPTDTTAGQTIGAGKTPAGVWVGVFDKFNNPEVGDSSDAVTLTVDSGPSSSLLGTLTETVRGGVAVFPNLSLDTAGSYTLQATSASRPTMTAGASAGFVIGPAAPDHLAFTQQPTDTPAGEVIDGNTAPAGVRVGLFDRFGNLATGDGSDAVTLTVQSGPNAGLLGTLTQTASSGVAVFDNLSLDVAGNCTLQASSPTKPALPAAPSLSFTVTATVPDHLAFAQQPTDANAGQAIDDGSVPAGVRVGLFDRFNNPEAQDNNDTVTLAVHAGPGCGLLGTLTQTAHDGVAIFPDLSLDAAGRYTLQASSPTQAGLTAVVSTSFVVGPAAPDHLAFAQQPTDTTAGQTINGGTLPVGVQVGLYDAFNNLETGDNGDTVTLAVQSGPGGSLLGTLTEVAGGGVAVFGDLLLHTAGSYTLQATSATQPDLAPVTSTSFIISPAAADYLAFVQQPSDTTAGQPIGGTTTPAGVRVGVFDRFNNPEAQDSSDAVTLAVRTGPSSSLLGTLTQTAGGGVAVFGDLALDASGSYTLQASSPTRTALASIASAGFAVTPAAADHLAFVQQPTDTMAGAIVSPAVTVEVLDRFNNRTASPAGVALALGAGPGEASLGGTRTQAAADGVATFNNLSIAVASAGWKLTASSPGVGSVTSAAFTVLAITPPAAANPAFLQSPADATEGLTAPALNLLFGPIVKMRIFRHHRRVPGLYVEQVSLFNASEQPMPGPFALVLQGLSARPMVHHHRLVMRSTHIRLLDANGFAQESPAPGSPYLFDMLGSPQLDPFQGATFVLNFSDPLNRPILYSPLVIAGEVP